MCELYGPRIQWLFVAGVALTGDHYRMNIINGVGYSRSDLVVPLMLYTVACNGWSTNIVLQVLRDSTNPTEKM